MISKHMQTSGVAHPSHPTVFVIFQTPAYSPRNRGESSVSPSFGLVQRLWHLRAELESKQPDNEATFVLLPTIHLTSLSQQMS
jgi:hypothetical protein